jgi:Fur family zinc uptake transcriptional regulator
MTAMTARSLQSAERLCRDKGLAFTQLRQQVYQLVAAQAAPVSAYELLDVLKTQRGNAAPVTVYRALEFLLQAGLVHRIDALHAYTACEAESADHGGMLLVCDSCRNITEFENAGLERQITRTALDHQFHTAHHLIEIRGLCGDCCSDPE